MFYENKAMTTSRARAPSGGGVDYHDATEGGGGRFGPSFASSTVAYQWTR